MTKKILIIELHRRFGGGQMHSLEMHKNLLKNGYTSQLLVPFKKDITEKLTQQNLPHIKTHILKLSFFKTLYQIALIVKLYTLCKKHKFKIIHCNKDIELTPAKFISKLLPVKVVYTCHTMKNQKEKKNKDLNGFISVNSEVVNKIKDINQSNNLSISVIEFIPPFLDEEKFINYKPLQNRQDFFQTNFGINLKPYPLISIIANLSIRKNQTIVFHAANYLIHNKNRPVQIALAGIGSQKKRYQKLVNKLKIKDYVYFLGFTDKTADLLFHSDIFILPSKIESFGIAYIEAALMKKAIIGTLKTGAQHVIKHEQTGLLFNYDDHITLAKHVEKIIDNPKYTKKLGENAYKFVIQNFSNSTKFKKLDELYKKVIYPTHSLY